VPRALPSVIGGVGALVETPLFFPSFTGRLNLQLLAETAGVERARVEECLEIVDLRERAEDRFRGYSLGMKQRLGIAAALLKRPRLLILDEPSNGLDPAGIREVRRLVQRLGADGHTTVFLSSHLLAEVQQVCDSVSILARGTCVASGPVAQVLHADSSELRVRVDDLPRARAVLEEAGLTVGDLGDALSVRGASDPADVTRALVRKRMYVSELTPVAADLESVFLELTGSGHSTAPTSGAAS
jgi:ABC-2 type transport system ATP-binding protein